MKKVFLLSLVLLVALSSVFSAGFIGITGSRDWIFFTRYEGTRVSDMRVNMATVMLDGATYFGERETFGIEYAIGAKIGLGTDIGEVSIDIQNKPIGLAFKLGAASIYNFNDICGMTFGVGLSGNYDSMSEGEAKLSELDLNYYGKIGFFVKPITQIMFHVGFTAADDIAAIMFYNNGSEKDTYTSDSSWFILSPYVGLSYAY